MAESRINLNDTYQDIVLKMAEGNYGAMNVLTKLIAANNIDKEVFEAVFYALLLDKYGIYGWRIYVLYSDICGGGLVKMMAVLRATHLGIFRLATLVDACNRQDYSGKAMVDPDRLYLEVKKVFPGFDAEGIAKIEGN